MTPDDRRAQPHDRWASRRLALAGAAVLALDAVLALAGRPLDGLAVAALLLSPGLALAALLPAPVRRHGLALAAAIPVLGFAASSTAIITMAYVGVTVDDVTCRVVLALVVAGGGAALPLRDRVQAPGVGEVALLALAVGTGVLLQSRVLDGFPVPGNDWAKYLLYADEIRRQGSLLIDNPFWMLGVPFREDPGVPAVYGAFLTMTSAPTSELAHGIWVFAVLGVLGVFAWVRALWGPVAGGMAALLYAVVPMNQDILGWHGLANVGALALLPLILLATAELLRGRLGRREAAGLALLLVALAAAHRLSVTVTLLGVAAAGIVALALGDRRAILRGAAWTVGWVVVLGWGVGLHLLDRNRTFGGTQGYEAYLNSKVDLELVVLDLTWTFTIAAAVAVAWGLWRVRRSPALGVPLALLAVVAALAYSWVVHLPLSYLRMAYYLPIVLAPLLGIALAWLGGRVHRWAPVVVGLVLAAVVAHGAWDRAGDVRRFYAFAGPASLQGLDAVAASLRPGEPVATDRCWSFLSTWLLRTRTLPALAPEDIQPKAELAIARRAQALLDGRPAAVRDARRLGIRYILTDPTCVDPQGRPLPAPLIGDPVYASDRLVVLAIPPDPRAATG